MSTYNEFDNEAIEAALEAAGRHSDVFSVKASPNSDLSDTGEFEIHAQCIKVTVEDHKVCLSLPLGIGKVCLPIPVNIPNGTAAEACIKICTTLGIPTGVKVYVKVAGVTIISKKFGKC